MIQTYCSTHIFIKKDFHIRYNGLVFHYKQKCIFCWCEAFPRNILASTSRLQQEDPSTRRCTIVSLLLHLQWGQFNTNQAVFSFLSLLPTTWRGVNAIWPACPPGGHGETLGGAASTRSFSPRMVNPSRVNVVFFRWLSFQRTHTAGCVYSVYCRCSLDEGRGNEVWYDVPRSTHISLRN